MNVIIVFIIGFITAILYARGKADAVQSLKVDAKRASRWCANKWKENQHGKDL